MAPNPKAIKQPSVFNSYQTTIDFLNAFARIREVRPVIIVLLRALETTYRNKAKELAPKGIYSGEVLQALSQFVEEKLQRVLEIIAVVANTHEKQVLNNFLQTQHVNFSVPDPKIAEDAIVNAMVFATVFNCRKQISGTKHEVFENMQLWQAFSAGDVQNDSDLLEATLQILSGNERFTIEAANQAAVAAGATDRDPQQQYAELVYKYDTFCKNFKWIEDKARELSGKDGSLPISILVEEIQNCDTQQKDFLVRLRALSFDNIEASCYTISCDIDNVNKKLEKLLRVENFVQIAALRDLVADKSPTPAVKSSGLVDEPKLIPAVKLLVGLLRDLDNAYLYNSIICMISRIDSAKDIEIVNQKFVQCKCGPVTPSELFIKVINPEVCTILASCQSGNAANLSKPEYLPLWLAFSNTNVFEHLDLLETLICNITGDKTFKIGNRKSPSPSPLPAGAAGAAAALPAPRRSPSPQSDIVQLKEAITSNDVYTERATVLEMYKQLTVAIEARCGMLDMYGLDRKVLAEILGNLNSIKKQQTDLLNKFPSPADVNLQESVQRARVEVDKYQSREDVFRYVVQSIMTFTPVVSLLLNTLNKTLFDAGLEIIRLIASKDELKIINEKLKASGNKDKQLETPKQKEKSDLISSEVLTILASCRSANAGRLASAEYQSLWLAFSQVALASYLNILEAVIKEITGAKDFNIQKSIQRLQKVSVGAATAASFAAVADDDGVVIPRPGEVTTGVGAAAGPGPAAAAGATAGAGPVAAPTTEAPVAKDAGMFSPKRLAAKALGKMGLGKPEAKQASPQNVALVAAIRNTQIYQNREAAIAKYRGLADALQNLRERFNHANRPFDIRETESAPIFIAGYPKANLNVEILKLEKYCNAAAKENFASRLNVFYFSDNGDVFVNYCRDIDVRLADIADVNRKIDFACMPVVAVKKQYYEKLKRLVMDAGILENELRGPADLTTRNSGEKELDKARQGQARNEYAIDESYSKDKYAAQKRGLSCLFPEVSIYAFSGTEQSNISKWLIAFTEYLKGKAAKFFHNFKQEKSDPNITHEQWVEKMLYLQRIQSDLEFCQSKAKEFDNYSRSASLTKQAPITSIKSLIEGDLEKWSKQILEELRQRLDAHLQTRLGNVKAACANLLELRNPAFAILRVGVSLAIDKANDVAVRLNKGEEVGSEEIVQTISMLENLEEMVAQNGQLFDSKNGAIKRLLAGERANKTKEGKEFKEGLITLITDRIEQRQQTRFREKTAAEGDDPQVLLAAEAEFIRVLNSAKEQVSREGFVLLDFIDGELKNLIGVAIDEFAKEYKNDKEVMDALEAAITKPITVPRNGKREEITVPVVKKFCRNLYAFRVMVKEYNDKHATRSTEPASAAGAAAGSSEQGAVSADRCDLSLLLNQLGLLSVVTEEQASKEKEELISSINDSMVAITKTLLHITEEKIEEKFLLVNANSSKWRDPSNDEKLKQSFINIKEMAEFLVAEASKYCIDAEILKTVSLSMLSELQGNLADKSTALTAFRDLLNLKVPVITKICNAIAELDRAFGEFATACRTFGGESYNQELISRIRNNIAALKRNDAFQPHVIFDKKDVISVNESNTAFNESWSHIYEELNTAIKAQREKNETFVTNRDLIAEIKRIKDAAKPQVDALEAKLGELKAKFKEYGGLEILAAFDEPVAALHLLAYAKLPKLTAEVADTYVLRGKLNARKDLQEKIATQMQALEQLDKDLTPKQEAIVAILELQQKLRKLCGDFNEKVAAEKQKFNDDYKDDYKDEKGYQNFIGVFIDRDAVACIENITRISEFAPKLNMEVSELRGKLVELQKQHEELQKYGIEFDIHVLLARQIKESVLLQQILNPEKVKLTNVYTENDFPGLREVVDSFQQQKRSHSPHKLTIQNLSEQCKLAEDLLRRVMEAKADAKKVLRRMHQQAMERTSKISEEIPAIHLSVRSIENECAGIDVRVRNAKIEALKKFKKEIDDARQKVLEKCGDHFTMTTPVEYRIFNMVLLKFTQDIDVSKLDVEYEKIYADFGKIISTLREGIKLGSSQIAEEFIKNMEDYLREANLLIGNPEQDKKTARAECAADAETKAKRCADLSLERDNLCEKMQEIEQMMPELKQEVEDKARASSPGKANPVSVPLQPVVPPVVSSDGGNALVPTMASQKAVAEAAPTPVATAAPRTVDDVKRVAVTYFRRVVEKYFPIGRKVNKVIDDVKDSLLDGYVQKFYAGFLSKTLLDKYEDFVKQLGVVQTDHENWLAKGKSKPGEAANAINFIGEMNRVADAAAKEIAEIQARLAAATPAPASAAAAGVTPSAPDKKGDGAAALPAAVVPAPSAQGEQKTGDATPVPADQDAAGKTRKGSPTAHKFGGAEPPPEESDEFPASEGIVSEPVTSPARAPKKVVSAPAAITPSDDVAPLSPAASAGARVLGANAGVTLYGGGAVAAPAVNEIAVAVSRKKKKEKVGASAGQGKQKSEPGGDADLFAPTDGLVPPRADAPAYPEEDAAARARRADERHDAALAGADPQGEAVDDGANVDAVAPGVVAQTPGAPPPPR